MFGLGIPELVLIALALGVLFFGGPKILELSKSLGRASGEFKKGKQDVERELHAGEQEAAGTGQVSAHVEEPKQ